MPGRVALVTGATKGIGKEIARSFLQDGMTVCLNYSSNHAAAEEARDELGKEGGTVVLAKADVSHSGEVISMVESVIADHGGIDVLVNNAGIIRDGLLMLMPEQNWHRVIEVNLNGVCFCSKAVLRSMIGNKWGRIINVISPSALMGRPGQTNYAASKGGVLSFTRSLAREVARYGITVNAVSPGVIETELTGDLNDRLKSELLSMIPAGRFGTPAEVARAARFLASDEAGYVTGQYISVDGGMT